MIENLLGRRVLKHKQGIKTIFSDHFAIKVYLKKIPKKFNSSKTESKWNTNKPGAWKEYADVTDKYASKIMKVVNDEYKNINQVIDKINKIENKIKFKVFGKTKLKVKQSKGNNDKNINEKNEILLNDQAKRIENEIQRIKQLKQGRATNVFKLRDVINGPKKAAQDPVALKNQDGELIVHPEQIMM